MNPYASAVFCGMTGADTPKKLDPRISASQESCDRFFDERIGFASRAGADHFIIHMPQGYLDGNDYSAALMSVLDEYPRNTFTRIAREGGYFGSRWSLYVGRLVYMLDPTSLRVGVTADTNNKPNMAGPEWQRFAQQEYRSFPLPVHTVFVDGGGDFDGPELFAWAEAIHGCGSELGTEPRKIHTDHPTIHTLAYARNFLSQPNGVPRSKQGPSAGLVAIEKHNDATLRELAMLSQGGWTLVPAWSLSAREMQACFDLNKRIVTNA